VSRGEGELLTVPKPRAVGLLSVCLTVKPVGDPDALIGHVRFDERGWETERCRMAQATAPILDSTFASIRTHALNGRFRGIADIGGFWPAMVRSRMTQLRHWPCTAALVLMAI
jgi:hypothetical protein